MWKLWKRRKKTTSQTLAEETRLKSLNCPHEWKYVEAYEDTTGLLMNENRDHPAFYVCTICGERDYDNPYRGMDDWD